MTSFQNLDDYVAIPRVAALRLAPDGSWLAAAVQNVSGEPAKYVTSIWRIPTDGGGRPVRLTRSAEGEGGPEFLPDGSLLFASKRPGPPPGPGDEAEDQAHDQPALWLLPAAGGEALRIAAPPGGVTGIAAASGAATVILASPALAGTSGSDEDAKRRKARKDAGVTAILHESGPLRYWDHDLGPDSPRLFAAEVSGPDETATQLRDLTPDPGRALDESSFEVTPDGSLAVASWTVWDKTGYPSEELHAIDTATGDRRVLLSAPGFDFEGPRISPDGRLVVCSRAAHNTYDTPGGVTLVVAAVEEAGGGPEPDPAEPGPDATAGPEGRPPEASTDLLPGLDRRPLEVAWAPDSGSVYFTADDQGRRPVFLADLASGEVTRLTSDDGAYDNLCPAPDGRSLYALRSAVDEPPTPVRLDLTAALSSSAGVPPQRLASPAPAVELPGRLEELETTADDGVRVRAWLVLPDGASEAEPAPLLLWVHGGPMMSWNAWSWRWNPWLMAARGYAVLLPDPALSTGYGEDFVARGHSQWGGRPYTDVMAITDAAAARADIDAARTAMMGGSFGGYMANWIAGHTDRFQAIVSHAGLWDLNQFSGTTDAPSYWRKIFGHPLGQPERYLANSPSQHVGQISTPMLVIHGDKDYRVPVGEALRLWYDLQYQAKDVKYLYFPDENHWILKPGHVTVWYETVLAFLAHHVLGEPWQRPGLL